MELNHFAADADPVEVSEHIRRRRLAAHDGLHSGRLHAGVPRRPDRPPMVAEAAELGAEAIVGTRSGTSMVVTGGAEVLAFGAAVVIEPEAAHEGGA